MPELSEILTGLRKKHGNKAQVAKKLRISSQLLGQYEAGRQKPKLDFYKKWKEVFNEDILKLIDETNVSHETENGTSATKPDNNEMSNLSRDEVYRDLVESNSEYRLVPKIILDKYEILSNREIKSKEDILKICLDQAEQLRRNAEEMSATKQIIIDDQKKLIASLESEIAELEQKLRITLAPQATQ